MLLPISSWSKSDISRIDSSSSKEDDEFTEFMSPAVLQKDISRLSRREELDYDFEVSFTCLREIASLETRLGSTDMFQDSLYGLREGRRTRKIRTTLVPR